MKKLFLFLLIFSLFGFCFAQEDVDDDTPTVVASKGGYAEVPPAKRPKPIDKEKAAAAAEKDETPKDEENNRNTIRYGVPSEISTLLDTLLKNDDPRFTEEIYDLFQVTKSSTIKEKVLKYFTKAEDPCLEDYAVDLLNDPYDETSAVVKATFQYVSAVKTTAAIPAVITLIESENENYFNDAIATLGDIGGPEEAMFLVEYLEREDLSDAQRQTLMRNCGKMHAVETWDKLVDILDNDDENTFVRMYAAESLGLMEVEKSVPILVAHFDETDPNLRQYVIKGLSHFPNVVEAKATVIQGIRDEYWRVRQEAIRTVKENDTKDAVPYLIYRAKNDAEKVIKEESYAAIAALNTDEGNDFLITQLNDKKVADGTKKKIVEVLLKEDHAGEKEIIELAKTVAEDDKRKDLRYAIAKEMVKNYKKSYDEVAALYLQSKDSTTVSLGLDMYKQKKSSSLEAYVNTIANEKKNSSNKTRAQKLLGIEEEEEENKTVDAK
ncbi:MAG: HEAT repeat domain-containing protein [Treponema sp.]|nr:HEAT repeat domain-containing protein [Treponema sp.]